MKIARTHFSKLANSILLIAIMALTNSSCSKDKTENPSLPASPATGFWVGSYSTIGQLGSSNYAMLIKPGGIARIYDMGTKTDTTSLAALAKVDAVWTFNGNTLQTSYNTGTKTVNTTANVNAAFNNMNGTWAFDGVVKGNITLSK